MDCTRRSVVLRITGFAAASLCCPVLAEPKEAKETDGDAAALGYRADAHNVDRSKYPQYSDPQQCGNCQLYQPQALPERGTCSALGAKLVRAQGWCTAYVPAM